jgi:glycosyltransferase involved in cell wall biosynthesis
VRERVHDVLLLIKGLGRGGAEQLLVSAAPHLDRSRFRYHVAYLLPWKDALVPALRGHGLEVHCLGTGPAWIGRLRSLVRRRGIRLVHAHSPYPAAVARVALPGVRHVYTEHNVWARYHPVTYVANRMTYRRNSHVFAVSEEVRGSIRMPPGARPPRTPVETLHPGLDPSAAGSWERPDGVRDELGISPAAPLAGTVGSLTPKKSHETLLRAARVARQRLPGLRVAVVGQGPLAGVLRRTAAELAIDDAVAFVGYREDAARVASAFDVFVLSSRHEGLPVALLEAMAAGRPVVATRVGGVPEVVRHGGEGILVPPGDPDALAAAMVTVLADANLRARLGEAARRRAADFDIRRTVRRHEEVYARLLEPADRIPGDRR